MKRAMQTLSNQPQFHRSLFFKLTIPLAGILLLSIVVLGIILRYSMDSTVTALLNREVAADSGNLRRLLQSRIKAVDVAAGILASDPVMTTALQDNSSDSLMLIDNRSIIIRDRFELDILQIYDANNVARTNIVQSSLYRVSSVIDIVPANHADLYLLGDRLVFLSRKELKGGVVIVGIDLLSELERLAYQLSLRDQVTLREGTLSSNPVYYAKSEFLLETLVPVGFTTVVFTIIRDTEQFRVVARTAQKVLLLSLLFTVVLLIPMILLVVRNIVNPIQSLSLAAREIANANFNGPFKARSFFTKDHNPFKIGFGDEIGQFAHAFTYMEKELHTAYSGLITDLKKANTELTEAYDATLQGWSSALELRDHEMEKHTSRVTKHVQEFARYVGISEQDIVNIRRGALLHDVGKMAIPDHILNKQGRLSEEEWNIIRQHPLYGFIMLRPIEHLKDAIDIPYCHHERWDGSGYPRGLRGAAIPLAARLFSIVDAWDGLAHDRPYRKARSQEEALDYIRSGTGKEFDPNLVEKFLEWHEIKSAAATAKLLEGIHDTGEGITIAYQHP